MKQEMEIPGCLTDWIEQYDFNELEENRKRIVLQFITREEYNSMHTLYINLNRSKPFLPQVGELVLPKAAPSRLTRLASVQLPILKVAAVFFVTLVGAFMLGYIMNTSNGSDSREKDYRMSNKPDSGTHSGIDSPGSQLVQRSQQESRPLKEDSLAAIFITGIYK